MEWYAASLWSTALLLCGVDGRAATTFFIALPAAWRVENVDVEGDGSFWTSFALLILRSLC